MFGGVTSFWITHRTNAERIFGSGGINSIEAVIGQQGEKQRKQLCLAFCLPNEIETTKDFILGKCMEYLRILLYFGINNA